VYLLCLNIVIIITIKNEWSTSVKYYNRLLPFGWKPGLKFRLQREPAGATAEPNRPKKFGKPETRRTRSLHVDTLTHRALTIYCLPCSVGWAQHDMYDNMLWHVIIHACGWACCAASKHNGKQRGTGRRLGWVRLGWPNQSVSKEQGVVGLLTFALSWRMSNTGRRPTWPSRKCCSIPETTVSGHTVGKSTTNQWPRPMTDILRVSASSFSTAIINIVFKKISNNSAISDG